MVLRTVPALSLSMVALPALFAALSTALPAHASCGVPPPIHVWPRRGVPVPTNAHVFMMTPSTWRSDATLSLVTAPRKGRPVAHVGLKEQSWRASGSGAEAPGTDRFELTPLAPLAPSTAYELRSSRGEILGIFTTSVLEDRRPPTWSGVTKGHLRKDAVNGVVRVPQECGEDLIWLEGQSEALDDQTTSDEIRYALWAGKVGAPMDYSAPPLTWVARDKSVARPGTPRPFVLTYGTTESASMDFDLPKDRPLRVGVKAYDLAANATEASEVTLE